MVAGVGRAFVERHHDICADGALDVDRLLGREEMLGAVDVGSEGDALFGDFPFIGQGVHLIAAGIGEDGAVPVDELVQAAGTFEDG